MNLRVEIIRAENGYIIQVADNKEQVVFISDSDDEAKKIIASTILAYFDNTGSNTTPVEPEISRPNRAARRANKAAQG